MADQPPGERRISAAQRQAWHDQAAARAIEALETARHHLDAGDAAASRRWLERAERLAPGDPTIEVTLASVLFGLGMIAEAERRFRALADRMASREAATGLAACLLARGNAAEAAVVMGRVLSRHVPDETTSGLAARIAQAANYPSWCGVDGDGTLSTDAARAGLAVHLDDRPVTLHPGAGPLRLPAAWRRSARLTVSQNRRPLLGSPIALDAIRRVEGVVRAEADGIAGWAWHPAEPGRLVRLALRPACDAKTTRAATRTIIADRDESGATVAVPLARPKGFAVPLAGLPEGPVAVTGPDGSPLLGSPVDPAARARARHALARARSGTRPPDEALAWLPLPVGPRPDRLARARIAKPPVAIVIPVHGGLAATQACLAAVFATAPRGTRIVVVDDATPEPALAQELDRLAARRRITLLRHAINRGFPAAANAGLRAAAGRDVILLNSDTLVPRGWVERLRAACHAAPDIGSVTPLSNDATILSYPSLERANPVPDAAAVARLDALAAGANPGVLVDLPTAHGFCVYLRHDCLAETGLLREDAFAQGYGEENDFCLRATALGWRHVALPSLFVGHVGSASFGPARAALIERNMAVLNALHPGYDALIEAFAAADPLFPARRAIDLARWRMRDEAAGRPTRGRGRSVVLVTHDNGGGVERCVGERCAALRAAGRRPIVLRPRDGRCAVSDGTAGDDYPSLGYSLPGEARALLAFLRAARAEMVEIHHRLGHDPSLLALLSRLGAPVEHHVHDYASFCPRIALVGGERRYCGEPDLAGCVACIADHGSELGEAIGVEALRARSAGEFARAARVVVPSADAAARLARHFPGLRPEVRPLERDGTLPPLARHQPGARLRIAVVGGIGIEKGYEVLLACARDATRRGLPLEFVVVGGTIDDARLMAAGPVFVTGAYAETGGEALLREQAAHAAFLPSVWPETWCYALGLAWRAGLEAAVFDLGAPAARVREAGRGLVIPFGAPAAAVNNALLSRWPLADAALTSHDPRARRATLC